MPTIPELQMPDIVGDYAKGQEIKYQKDERARKQPIMEQMEKLALQKAETANKTATSAQTLKDFENKGEVLKVFSQGMDWINEQPVEAQPELLEDLNAYIGESGIDIGDDIQNNPDLMAKLGSIKDSTGSKFTAPVAGLDSEGKPVYKQFSQTGEGKNIEGFTPLTSQYKADAARLKTQSMEEEKTKALLEREQKLEGAQLKIQKDKLAVLKSEMDIQRAKDKQAAADIEAFDTMALYEDVLSGDLESIYGIEEQLKWDRLRTQDARDLMSKRNRLVATMELAAAGKLKGQGQVSEGERAILKAAASSLADSNISPEMARGEVQRALKGLKEAASPAIDRRNAAKKQNELDGALKWLQENPNDPKAQQVRQKLGL